MKLKEAFESKGFNVNLEKTSDGQCWPQKGWLV